MEISCNIGIFGFCYVTTYLHAFIEQLFSIQNNLQIAGKNLPDGLSYIQHCTVVYGNYIHIFKGKKNDQDMSSKNYYMELASETWTSYEDNCKETKGAVHELRNPSRKWLAERGGK